MCGAGRPYRRLPKSLVMVGMMAAAGHPNELRVHLQGALKNGCKVEEIQEVLLLLAMYCGIPAANEAHRIAVDLLGDQPRLAAERMSSQQGRLPVERSSDRARTHRQRRRLVR